MIHLNVDHRVEGCLDLITFALHSGHRITKDMAWVQSIGGPSDCKPSVYYTSFWQRIRKIPVLEAVLQTHVYYYAIGQVECTTFLHQFN